MKKQFVRFIALSIGLALLATDISFAQDKPDSKYNGVQIGAITYSYRDMRLDVEGTLKACVESGLSSIELMGTGVEDYLGAPKSPLTWREVRKLDDQDKKKQKAYAQYLEDAKVWRYSEGTMQKYTELRKKFNDAGVEIHIYKWTAGMSDEELDYSFLVAKTLGAIGITTEIGEETCTKVGAAAERAGMVALFHNHYQYAEEDFDVDKLLALNPANRLNFDIGHYLGSTGKDPVAFIEKYHEQIGSLHLKDKTAKDNEVKGNVNKPFGQGDTPVNEVLQLVQKNGWPIYCDIELEYKIPEGSDAVKETAICREYCKKALL